MNNTALLVSEYVQFVDNELGGNVWAISKRKDELVIQIQSTLQDVIQKLNEPTIDPFSEVYFDSMIDLYLKISGAKELNQAENELHPVNPSLCIQGINPNNIVNTKVISEQVRSSSLMLSICSDLKPNPRILDLGVGAGLTSEIYSFCGSEVTAVDLDPSMLMISKERAAVRNLNIRHLQCSYDDVYAALNQEEFDLITFLQSFHHSTAPHKLLRDLKELISDEGVIIFTGEPLQDAWWNHWGIRLDMESLYVAGKFGWYENGWSIDFAKRMAEMCNINYAFFEGGLEGGLIGIYSKSEDSILQIKARAATLKLRTLQSSDTYQYYGQGKHLLADGRDELVNIMHPPVLSYDLSDIQATPNTVIAFGPYVDNMGFQVCVTSIKNTGLKEASFIVDLLANGEAMVIPSSFNLKPSQSKTVIFNFNELLMDDTLVLNLRRIEARIICKDGYTRLSVSLPRFY